MRLSLQPMNVRAMLAATAVIAAMGGTMGTAEAKPKKQFGVMVHLGAPYYSGYYGYAPSCRWMKRKAMHTGSHYWWRRYRECING